MSRLTKFTLPILGIIFLGLAACSGGSPTPDASLALTQIWQTVQVAQAQTAQASSATPSLTSTPTVLATQGATNTPLLTETPVTGAPTATLFSIKTSTPAGTRSAVCDNANFVSDITVPDGSEEPANTPFVKTWRFKNIGPCTWTTSYRLLFSYVSDSGKNGVFSPPPPVMFPNTVLPGAEVDISVTLTAPSKPGTYQVVFVLQNSKGYDIPLVNKNTYEFYVLFVVK